MLLAGDVGGTKTHLALFTDPKNLHEPLLEAVLPSAKYHSLEALIGEFLSKVTTSIEYAVLGVAGPVFEGKAQITNLPWIIDITTLQNTLHIANIHLLNDLAALAHAIPLLEASDLYTLNKAKAKPEEPLAVIAPGTGLGEAFLTWDGSGYLVHPTEGGHCDFAPTTSIEMELLRYLLNRFDHVSYELVCSGIGLPNIYAYLKESNLFDEPVWLQEQLSVAKDVTPVIVNTALLKENAPAICTSTVKMFTSILGAEAGNLALKTLATGGIYLAGGIPPRILPFLEQGYFLQAFQSKGRFSKLLTNIPVHVVLNPKVALLGAAAYGFHFAQ